VTIALAVAVATSLFTVVNALVLRPVPGVRAPDLVKLYVTRDGALEGLSGHAHPTFRDIAERSGSLARLAANAGGGFAVSAAGDVRLVLGQLVSGNFFDTLGTRPLLGRLLGDEDDRAPGATVAVISHAYWVDHLGAAPDILGRSLGVNGHAFTVVGVAEPGFRGPFIGFPSDVFVPLAVAERLAIGIDLTDRRDDSLELYAQLRPGVPITQAQADLDRVIDGLRREHPDVFRQRGIVVLPWRGLDADLSGPVLSFVGVLAAIGGLVIVIASVNVAGLLLHRGQLRRVELAVRQALGAGRATLIRQLTVETLLLFAVGQTMGVLLAVSSTHWLHAFLPDFAIPVRLDLAVDWRVWLLVTAVTFVTAVLFGIIPGATATRIDPSVALKPSVAGVPHQFRIRRALVAAQVSVALVLLITAGLFARTLARAATLETGFETPGVGVATADVAVLSRDEPAGRAFFETWLERVSRQPGIESAALSSSLPLALGRVTTPVSVEGRDPFGGDVASVMNVVTADYFRTLGIPILAGRTFTLVDDSRNEPVAIVSRTAAGRLFGSADPLDRHLIDVDVQTRRRVVGVAGDVAVQRPGELDTVVFYVPYSQRYTPRLSLVARGADPPPLDLLRREARDTDAAVPLLAVEPLEHRRETVLFPQRMAASIAAALGLLGLGLAVVGLYGVVAFQTAERRRELAVRVALGATRGEVRRLVITDGLKPVGLGLLVGVPAAGLLAGRCGRT
jgi:predicted permease